MPQFCACAIGVVLTFVPSIDVARNVEISFLLLVTFWLRGKGLLFEFFEVVLCLVLM